MRKRLRKIFLNIMVLFVTISLINTTSGIKAIFETKPDEIIMLYIFIDGKIEKLYKEFKNNDEDFERSIFVVEADNYKANYFGKIYYDYKVAQHTSDYLEWTSSSKNGWENVGGRYAIVRQ